MRIITLYFIASIFFSCSDSSGKDDRSDGSHITRSDDEDDNGASCGIDDGTHSATINYYNPNTGHSATYMLDVEVEDCQVTEIDFKNGGYLDNTHITPADIDENGDASVQDDQGRSFDVHIDK